MLPLTRTLGLEVRQKLLILSNSNQQEVSLVNESTTQKEHSFKYEKRKLAQ